MTHTTDLLHQALTAKSASDWARTLNITPQALSMAKKQGRLSPALAGNLAIGVGQDPTPWVALAAIEALESTNPNEAKRLRKACHFS